MPWSHNHSIYASKIISILSNLIRRSRRNNTNNGFALRNCKSNCKCCVFSVPIFDNLIKVNVWNANSSLRAACWWSVSVEHFPFPVQYHICFSQIFWIAIDTGTKRPKKEWKKEKKQISPKVRGSCLPIYRFLSLCGSKKTSTYESRLINDVINNG